MLRSLGLAALSFSLALAVAACGSSGGGSSGGSSGGVASTGPSTAEIAWPPAGFVTDQAAVLVRGTADDPDGVAGVSVNGAVATSMDGFAHWEAVVPLAFGTGALVVDVLDGVGAVTADAADARDATRAPYLATSPQAMTWHAASGRHLVLDNQRRALFAIDPATGEGAELSGPAVGTGPALVDARDFVLDPTSANHVYVTDNSQQAVLRVNLLTGDRVAVTGLGVGSGIAISRPSALTYDTVGGRLLVADTQFERLVGVDPATGDRTEVSGGAVGMGPALAEPVRVVMWDGKALVHETVQRLLIAVDLATGDRTAVTDFANGGQGPILPAPNGLLVDETTDTAFFGVFSATVYQVDLTTGTRSLFSGTGAGVGPLMRNIVALTHGPAAGQVSVFDWERGSIFTIDRANGDRAEVYRPARGTGALIERPGGVAVAADGQSLYVVDLFAHLLQVDLASGDRATLPVTGAGLVSTSDLTLDTAGDRAFLRGSSGGQPLIYGVDLLTNVSTVVSGGGVGNGPTDNMRGIAYDALAGRLVVARNQPGTVLAVDPAIGDRVELSGAMTGMGDALTSTYDVDVDPTSGLVYAVSSTGVVTAVDAMSGDRTTVSGGGVGAGAAIPASAGMRVVLDAAAGRLLVLSTGTLVAVDLATGDRTVLSDLATGSGPIVSSYASGDIALDAARGVLWVVDNGTNALLAIDLATGDRVVVSH